MKTDAHPIVYIDRSELLADEREEVEAAIEDLVAFADREEPQLLAYSFSLEDDRMTVVAIHPDAASLERHMDIAGPMFRRFEGLIALRGIEVFGTVTDRVREQLRAKAELLGGGSVVIHEQHAGFSRLAPD